MSDAKLTVEDLDQFTGSDKFYKHESGMAFTEGVQYMADKAQAYWLIDAIASYRGDRRIRFSYELVEFQIWTLTVHKFGGATLSMKGDSDLPNVIHQDIESTDFPLPNIILWVCDFTLMLPGEC